MVVVLYLFMWLGILAPHLQDDFSFRLTMARIEKSKDSYTIVETWNVEGSQLAYTKKYSGRFSNKAPEEKSATLNKTQLETLSKLMFELSLQKDISTPKLSNFEVPYSALMADFSLQQLGSAYSITLFDLAKNIEENKDYQNLQTLQRHLIQLLKD